ncbi:unnamed protein product [Mytilus coruscus]|uniref:UvrD-like helicase ATP-binding domain-containing protein n=1 Tax=Mytilus coruscus TaxID=42192 RepID=A0A6J8EVY7_MYTCO|nr:unnamed protein product [Mytilus coruscus]
MVQKPESDKLKEAILQQLSTTQNWNGVSYVIIGNITGTDFELAGLFSKCCCRKINVCDLLKNTSTKQKKDWGLKLAIELLKNGALLDNFESEMQQSRIHYGIQISLETVKVDFLKYLLSTSSSSQRNSVDIKGDTGLHFIVKSKDILSTTLGDTLLRLLVNHECEVNVKDRSGKIAIEYVKNTDTAYSVLLPKSDKTAIFPEKLKTTESKNIDESAPVPSSTVGKDVIFNTCRKCRALFVKCKTTIRRDTANTFTELIKLCKIENHNSEKHTEIVDKCITLISDSIAQTDSCSLEILRALCSLPNELYRRIIEDLVKQRKWLQLNMIVNEHWKESNEYCFADFAKNISVDSVITHLTKKDVPQENIFEIVSMLIHNGCILYNDGKSCIINAVRRKRYLLLEKFICEQDADPRHLSLLVGDTPIHAALEVDMNLDKGTLTIFNKCLELFEKEPNVYAKLNPHQLDGKGNTLFHLVARHKFNKTSLKATELLAQMHVECKVLNSEDKYPPDYLKITDSRLKLIQHATYVEKETKDKSKFAECSSEKDIPVDAREHLTTKVEQNSELQFTENKKEEIRGNIENSNVKATMNDKITKFIDDLEDQSVDTRFSKDTLEKKEPHAEILQQGEDIEVQNGQVPPDVIDSTKNLELENLLKTIDDKPWELECTFDLRKAMQRSDISTDLRCTIAERILQLASGEYTKDVKKRLKTNSEKVKLYEAKISKGSRLIWEEAISFSQRLSSLPENRSFSIYAQIIRIWDIVLDHKKIHRSVEKIIERIENAHTKGKSCLIQKKLKPYGKHGILEKNTEYKYPKLYVPYKDDEDMPPDDITVLYPLANSKPNEYNTEKFYAVSSTLAANILNSISFNTDYPFQVTEFEYQMISLPQFAPIILIGRSGTGKTTCCLYRLWNTFKQYWLQTSLYIEPLLPGFKCISDYPNACSYKLTKDVKNVVNDDSLQDTCQREQLAENVHHLHQIFVTKNSFLSKEVHRTFKEFLKAYKTNAKHLQMTNKELPYRIQDVNDHQFPLFITARQLWLMLDATLGPPYYFDRNIDGSPKSHIEGWTNDDDDVIDILHSDEDGSDESGSEDEIELHEMGRKLRLNRKVDPRREVTYDVFVEKIWPKVKLNSSEKKYHPSLIWTEIFSFLKGSYEAVSSEDGFLNETEYSKIGRKRAPAYSEERENIYQLFQLYERFRKSKGFFDQTDFIFNLHKRFQNQKHFHWIVHQIYIDETQDFTQAELSLLIKICGHPSGIFMTGDTAQSIMKGVSFRFADLISLFRDVADTEKKKQSKILDIPKDVYQLTHNYRSHTGIVALASSILGLLTEMFPESFDKLTKEQSLFPGPKPVLIESCRFQELAEMIHQHKRKTSHIEFGAHQAILVVDDASRKSIPAELSNALVLTIYEAKGLEFDDVLLYNVFKHSKASKDWRVVTSFIKDVRKSQSEAVGGITRLRDDNIRTRHLEFDPHLHKILNSELKQLYTAVTRARVNVWIFDEDEDIRLPMFEFFNALNLVQTVSNISDIESFAKPSLEEDWIKRGEEFMRNHLYSFAADCFKKGGDEKKEKLADAFIHYEQARQNPKEMRKSFYKSAELFLELGKYTNAGKCLENTKDFRLAAQLYEKRNQHRKAGHMYKILKETEKSAKCFERIGYYNEAIECFLQQNMFKEAMLVTERNKLTEQETYGPRSNQSLRSISESWAELYHRKKDQSGMMVILKNLPISEQVEFLEKRHTEANQYIYHAKNLFIKNGFKPKAADLCLRNGLFTDAFTIYKDIGDKEMAGRCLIYDTRVKMELGQISKYYSEDKLHQAIKLCSTNNGLLGDAYYLLGLLTSKERYIQEALRLFDTCEGKEIGFLESTDWLMCFSIRSDKDIMNKLIKGMMRLFQVLTLLTRSANKINQRIYAQYGINVQTGGEHAFFNPKQKPLIMKLLRKNLIPNKNNPLKVKLPLPTIRYEIISDLLSKCTAWYIKIKAFLYDEQTALRVCTRYKNDPLKCSWSHCCTGLHRPMNIVDFGKLIKSDIILIEIEDILDSGIKDLSSILMGRERKVLAKRELQPDVFLPCKRLLNDLVHLTASVVDFYNESNASAIWFLISDINGVKRQLQNYVTQQYVQLRTNKEQHLSHFLEILTCIKVFGIHVDAKKDLSNFLDIVKIEFDQGNASQKQLKKCGFIFDSNTGKFITSLARHFVDAFYGLTDTKDPFKAIEKFSNYLMNTTTVTHTSSLSELGLNLMWLRFYTFIGFCLLSKYSHTSSFYIPSSFLSIVQFIDMSVKPSTKCSTVDLIALFGDLSFDVSHKLGVIFKTFIQVTTGMQSKSNFLKTIFDKLYDISSRNRDTNSPDSERFNSETNIILLAEDILTLCTVFLVNIRGLSLSYLESAIVERLLTIKSENKYPVGMKTFFRSFTRTSDTKCFGFCLRNFLNQKEEKLLKCTWDEKKMMLNVTEIFSDLIDTFQSESQKSKASAHLTYADIDPITDQADDNDFSDDEELGNCKYSKEKQSRSAKIICSFLKNLVMRRKLKETQNEKEKHVMCNLLRNMTIVDDTQCDICGITFHNSENVDELSRLLDTEFHVSLQSLQQHTLPSGNNSKSSISKTNLSNHIQSSRHIMKEEEFDTFKNEYNRLIQPVAARAHALVTSYDLESLNLSEFRATDSSQIRQFVKLFERLKEVVEDIVKETRWQWKGGSSLIEIVAELDSMENAVREIVLHKNMDTEMSEDFEELQYRPLSSRAKKTKRQKTRWNKLE